MIVVLGGRNGAGWWHKGWYGDAGAGSTAAPAGSLMVQGRDDIGVYGDEIFREPFNRGRELGNGFTIAGRGCCQFRDGVQRLLL